MLATAAEVTIWPVCDSGSTAMGYGRVARRAGWAADYFRRVFFL
ncbi:hypothetical protein TIFTF001_024695 [Ficus carica]|uniref:Uncharacterized protein n=1 Tax=Ficus carica TaxID=3494 RepID=A0AA88AMW0_FICCA|nr:hypothetical protein TIFTF001_024695 [Ficus carica]